MPMIPEDQGRIRSIALAAPAAGADYADTTVPTGARWRLISLWGQLINDANSANRRLAVTITDGTNDVLVSTGSFELVASVQADVVAGDLPPTPSGPASGEGLWIPLPRNLHLSAGWEIQMTTRNIQVGDQWSAGRLLVEEWIEA